MLMIGPLPGAGLWRHAQGDAVKPLAVLASDGEIVGSGVLTEVHTEVRIEPMLDTQANRHRILATTEPKR